MSALRRLQLFARTAPELKISVKRSSPGRSAPARHVW